MIISEEGSYSIGDTENNIDMGKVWLKKIWLPTHRNMWKLWEFMWDIMIMSSRYSECWFCFRIFLFGILAICYDDKVISLEVSPAIPGKVIYIFSLNSRFLYIMESPIRIEKKLISRPHTSSKKNWYIMLLESLHKPLWYIFSMSFVSTDDERILHTFFLYKKLLYFFKIEIFTNYIRARVNFS